MYLSVKNGLHNFGSSMLKSMSYGFKLFCIFIYTLVADTIDPIYSKLHESF